MLLLFLLVLGIKLYKVLPIEIKFDHMLIIKFAYIPNDVWLDSVATGS